MSLTYTRIVLPKSDPYRELLERRTVEIIQGDFARGQRERPIAVENAIIPRGHFHEPRS